MLTRESNRPFELPAASSIVCATDSPSWYCEFARAMLHIYGGLVAIFWSIGLWEAPWGLIVVCSGAWMIARAERAFEGAGFVPGITATLIALTVVAGSAGSAAIIERAPPLSIPAVLVGLSVVLAMDLIPRRSSANPTV